MAKIKDQNVWRIQTNVQLQVMNRKPNTVTAKNQEDFRVGWSCGKNV